MRQTSKTRRTIGIRGQLMGFLCFICFLLVGLFWFLSTQLLEPLYTTHIQKQLTEQAEAIVARMDEAIERGETLSYWAFGSQLYVNNTFFTSLRDDIFETGGMSSFCIDISDTTLRQIFKVDNLSYCNLHRTRPTLPTRRRPTQRPAPCASSAGRAAARWCGRSIPLRPPARCS